MKRRYYLPKQISGTANLSPESYTRLQTVIVNAIRLAVTTQDQSTTEIVPTDLSASETTYAAFTPTRYQSDRQTYSIPSYKDGGSLQEIPVEAGGNTEVGGSGGGSSNLEPEVITSTIPLHSQGEVNQGRVVDHPSPFEGELVAIFGEDAVRIHSQRYAIADHLSRALGWGEYLFGTKAFVILEGPFAEPGSLYYVLGTTQGLTWSPHQPSTGQGDVQAARYWASYLSDALGKSYVPRVLVTCNGHSLFPDHPQLLEEFWSEPAFSEPEPDEIPSQLARSLVFAEINHLLDHQNLEAGAQRLAELDAHAFSLLDWETKARYLQVLINSSQEVAIIEIIKSIHRRSELFAALSRLQKAGLYDQIFAHLDRHTWSLFILVGERFGSPEPMTWDFLVKLLQEVGLIPLSLETDLFNTAVLAEREASAGGFETDLFNTAVLAEREASAGDFSGSRMLISTTYREPLVRLLVMVHLARLGYQRAVVYLDNLLSLRSQKVISGFRGAIILNITGERLLRIKWAIIREIASWLMGVGEVRSISAMARLLGILGCLGGTTETEHLTGKLQTLARIVSQSGPIFHHEDEVLRILSDLSEEEVRLLARALEAVTLDESMDLARLELLLGDASEIIHKAKLKTYTCEDGMMG
jgi:hypothetical protein